MNKHRKRSNFLATVTLFLMSSFTVVSAEYVIARIVGANQTTAQRYADQNYDITSFRNNEYLDVSLSREAFDSLKNSGEPLTIFETESDIKAKLNELKTISQDANRAIPGCRSYEQMIAKLKDLETKYPKNCKVITIGSTMGKKYADMGKTAYAPYKDHLVYALKISQDVSVEADKPNFVFMGGTHAREMATPEIAIAIADLLMKSYGTDQTITKNINESQIWIIPSSNPNGHEIVYNNINTNHRKTVADNNNNGKYDNVGDGVDPNRNYDFQWGVSGTSSDPSKDNYLGPKPFSEEETKNIKAFFEARHFVAGITFHSYAEQLLYPYGYANGTMAPDNNALKRIANLLVSVMPKESGGNYEAIQAIDLYPASGAEDDWAYYATSTFLFTCEVATSFIPSSTKISGLCTTQPKAALLLLNSKNSQVVTGNITDGVTGKPIVAKIFVKNIDDKGSKRTDMLSNAQYGRYFRYLNTGTYEITFSAPEYQSKTVTAVTTNNSEQTILDVKLYKNGTSIAPINTNQHTELSVVKQSKGEISVSFNTLSNTVSMEITNTLGRTLFSDNVNVSNNICTIKNHGLSTGVYFIRLKDKELTQSIPLLIK